MVVNSITSGGIVIVNRLREPEVEEIEIHRFSNYAHHPFTAPSSHAMERPIQESRHRFLVSLNFDSDISIFITHTRTWREYALGSPTSICVGPSSIGVVVFTDDESDRARRFASFDAFDAARSGLIRRDRMRPVIYGVMWFHSFQSRPRQPAISKLSAWPRQFGNVDSAGLEKVI
jgi:hypothetical protein